MTTFRLSGERPTTCADCATPTDALETFAIFDGAALRHVCIACTRRRCAGPVSRFALGDGWILGHAAATNVPFLNRILNRLEVFAQGAFRAGLYDSPRVALGANHQCSRHKPESFDELDFSKVFVTTVDGSLIVGEDPFGLFFAARPRPGQAFDGVPLREAVSRGTCTGVSAFVTPRRSLRVVSTDLPNHFVFGQCVTPEISLVFDSKPGSPNTWVRAADDAAMAALYARLKASLEWLVELS